MRCPNCEVESGLCTKFCPECGNGLLPLTSAKTCQSRKDDGTICGQVLQDGVKFCPSCGKPVEKIITCRHCNSNLVANASFCQNCGKPVSDTKKKIPEQDIQQRQGDLVAPSEERKAPGASNEEEFGSISFIDADGAPETIPKGTEHDDNDSSQSEEEEWFDTKNEVDETNEEGRLTQDSPRPDGEDETKQELQLQAGDDTPQKDTKTEISIESANTKNNSEDEVQHVEITVSKKANDSTENFGNLYKQPAMGLETDVDSFKQSIIYQAVEENWIRISFHALIAPNMKFEHQNDIVVLHMWTKNGNGGTVNWKKPMTFEGTHLEVQGVAEVKFEVDLPKSDVFNARISYKYYVERNSMKPDGTKRKDVWECLYGNKSDNDRRQLLVNKSSEGLGYWHQYDGFIYKKTKPKKPKEAGGFMKSLKSGYEYVIGTNATDRDKDPEIVLRVFGGQIANMWSKMYQLPHLVDMIKNMSYQLFICTESIYSFGKNWRTIRQQVNQTLWKTFTDCYKSLQDGSSDEDIKRKTCLSIVMLYIRKLTCTKTDEQALQFLCSCFLVHSDGSKQRVREYDVLLQHFSNKDRDELKSELVLLVCEMTSQVSKDPSWWYLLPILHFLSRTCAPFEEVSHNANHAAVKPYWWGLMITEDFEKIKNRYMYNQHRPKIHPHTIIRKMRSLFTADYYLPRSIVASLTLDEIEELIKDSTMIPHEVFFAAMYFFMVSEQETSTKVTKCLDALLNQVQVQKME